MNRVARAAGAATFSTSTSITRRCFSLNISADKSSHPRPLHHLYEDDDDSSPVSQIVQILKHHEHDNWKSNSQLNHLLFSFPSLSSTHFLRIARHLPTSGAALKFVEHLQSSSCQFESASLSSVFQAAFEISSRERSSIDKLWLLVERSKELGVPLSVNSATLLIRRFEGSVDRAMSVYDAVEPRLRNVNVRNLILRVLFRRGCLKDARKVLDEMLEPESEVYVNDSTVKIVVEWSLMSMMHGQRSDDEEIVYFLSRLGESGLMADYQKLTEMITEPLRKGMKDRSFVAWDFLQCYLKLDGDVEASCCNSMLYWLAKKGEFNKFSLLLKEMEKKRLVPDGSTYGILINQLCKCGRLNESLEMIKKMRDEGVNPDVVTYNMVVSGFCKAGKVQEGLVLMEKMKAQGHLVPNASTYNCLIDGFCRAGDLTRSLELFEVMKREEVKPNVITINGLINGMCKQGKTNTALQFFNEQKERGLNGNVKTYTTLISAFCEVNNLNKAMDLFYEMKRICKPDAIVYYTLVLGFCRGGHMEDASSIMSLMRESGFRPDVACYNTMISGFCKRKKMDKASELLKEMQMDGTKPDCVTYNTLISYFSKSGDFKMAQTLLETMLNDGLRPTVVTYGALINAYCLAGSTDDAMKIFKEMSSRGNVLPNTVIYNSLIDNHCKKNKVEAALFLFDDMTEKGLKPNANTYNAMLRGLRDIRWLDKAFELMDRMICEGCDPDYGTMEVLTEWLPAVGESDRLKKFVQGHQDGLKSMLN